MKIENEINPSNRFRYFLEDKITKGEADSLLRPIEMHYFFKKYPVNIISTGSHDFIANLNLYFEEIDEFGFPNPYTLKIMIINYLIRDIEFTIKEIEIYRMKKSKIPASRIKLRHYGITDISKASPKITELIINNLSEYKEFLKIEFEHHKRVHASGIENPGQKIIKVQTPKIIWLKTLKSLYTLFGETRRLGFIQDTRDIYKLLSEHFAVLDEKRNEIIELEPKRIKDYMAKLESEEYLHEKDDVILKIIEKVKKEFSGGKENAN